MNDKIRWGIIATGAIARDFAEGLAILPDADLVAVGSRAQETADRFGEEYGVPRRYGSYEAVARDPEVDVAYIATPHTLHRDNTLLCLSAGKAVLCEKPFAINAAQAEEMVSLARRKKLFLMEAMWNRFHPVVLKMGSLLAEGAIGKPRLMVADFGLGTTFDPKGRLFDIELGGGALLDLGVYPVALASLVFIAANLTLGLVFSSLSKSQFQATQMSFFFFLPSVLLSGFMFPFDAMPEPAQWLGEILPLTHFVRICRGILLRGSSLGDHSGEMAAMLLFAAAGFLAAIRLFKKQLD